MDFWSFFWLLVWSFFFVAYLIMLFHIFGDLFRDKELGGFSKVLWVIVLFIFPLLSALIYLIVRGRGMAEREMQAAEAQMAAQEKYIRSVAGGTASTTDQLYQAKSLLDSGARLAMGSDWSVSTPNPFEEMEVAVTRVYPESRGVAEPFLPDQALTLAEAIRAFTLGSAFVNHLDAQTGSIEVGKLADLAVIDRDPFEPDAGPIGDAIVLGTLVGGELVHEAPALG